MPSRRYIVKDPNKAYVSNNLWLPKSAINAAVVKAALTFTLNEEESVIDELSGEEIGTRAKILRLWDETKNHVITPKEFIPRDDYPEFHCEFEYISPPEFERVRIDDRIELRDEDQCVAYESALAVGNGTLSIACGKGKTIIALKVAATLKVPTIIIVNSTALLEQWKEEVSRHVGAASIGIIQGPTQDWRTPPIVLAMVHTLSNKRKTWPLEFKRRFGLAIYDECFPAGTLVGGTPIQDVQPGDLVPSYSQRVHRLLDKRVTRVLKRRVSELVKVQAAGYSVICTPSHPFLTESGYVAALNLKAGSWVLVRDSNDLYWAEITHQVSLLNPGSDGTFGELCPDGFVYNLEVEDTHTYVANGFVVHNCHHMSAPVFVLSADMFYGKRLSLTATATRTDGLEVIYQYHLGRVMHKNLVQELIPHTVFHVLHWVMPPEHRKLVVDRTNGVNTPKVRTYLGRLEWRNSLIYEHILKDIAEGRTILVLSHSVAHVETLHEYMNTSGVGSGMIVGKTLQENRMAILRNANPVFGTFQLAREGLNKPSLDTLYVVTPFGNSNDLQQAWGRIQRRFEDKKEPLVRVFEDTAFSCCVSSCKGLRAVLRKFGYPYTKEEWRTYE